MTEPIKKKSTWLLVLTIVATAVGAWAGITISQYVFSYLRTASVQLQLQQTSTELNKKLPEMVDAETRLDSTSVGSNNTLRYHYTLIHVKTGQITPEKIVQILRPKIVKGYRTNPGMQALRDGGVSLEYEYFDEANQHITDITVGPTDLGK